jgi:hypothetical protein
VCRRGRAQLRASMVPWASFLDGEGIPSAAQDRVRVGRRDAHRQFRARCTRHVSRRGNGPRFKEPGADTLCLDERGRLLVTEFFTGGRGVVLAMALSFTLHRSLHTC